MKAIMIEPAFFSKIEALTLSQIAEIVNATLPEGTDGSLVIENVAPIDAASGGDITFLDNPKYVADLQTTTAGAVLCSKRYAEKVPEGVVALVVGNPYEAFSLVLSAFYPESDEAACLFRAKRRHLSGRAYSSGCQG